MPKQSQTAAVYLYDVSAPNGQVYRTAAPSIDNAAEGIEMRFGLTPGSCKAQVCRIDGLPMKILLHPLLAGRAGLKPTEQCWAPVNHKSDRRCQNPARDGYQTCKIHTLFEAPFPAGTPEYREWIAKPLEDDDDEPDAKPARKRVRRSQTTRAAAGESLPAKPVKPAKRRSGARRRPANP